MNMPSMHSTPFPSAPKHEQTSALWEGLAACKKVAPSLSGLSVLLNEHAWCTCLFLILFFTSPNGPIMRLSVKELQPPMVSGSTCYLGLYIMHGICLESSWKTMVQFKNRSRIRLPTSTYEVLGLMTSPLLEARDIGMRRFGSGELSLACAGPFTIGPSEDEAFSSTPPGTLAAFGTAADGVVAKSWRWNSGWQWVQVYNIYLCTIML